MHGICDIVGPIHQLSFNRSLAIAADKREGKIEVFLVRPICTPLL
jgi:hypothetical protein